MLSWQIFVALLTCKKPVSDKRENKEDLTQMYKYDVSLMVKTVPLCQNVW